MNHGSLRTSLFMICIFAAQAVVAQCPEGKSEIVVVTPSGVSRNICVSQAAIPGIETAGNNEVINIVPACPCADVWTGVYSDDVETIGSPPLLPNDLAASQCTVFIDRYNFVDIVVHTGASEFSAATTTEQDLCRALSQDRLDQANLILPRGELFPQEDLDNDTIDDPRLEACRQFLTFRNCQFN